MTDYKAIADRLVELGIGCRLSKYQELFWIPNGYEGDEPVDAKTFCHDWRVAGAFIEKTMRKTDIERIFDNALSECHVDNPLPRAIIEACMEALDKT